MSLTRQMSQITKKESAAGYMHGDDEASNEGDGQPPHQPEDMGRGAVDAARSGGQRLAGWELREASQMLPYTLLQCCGKTASLLGGVWGERFYSWWNNNKDAPVKGCHDDAAAFHSVKGVSGIPQRQGIQEEERPQYLRP